MPPWLTVDSLAALVPCREYLGDDCARLRRLFGRRKRVRVRTALLDSRVPAKDRIWLGIELLPGGWVRCLFAAECAGRAQEQERAAGRDPDRRLWHAVEVARRYAWGEATDKELAVAWAAGAAAWAAATAAAAAERAWQIGRLLDLLADEVAGEAGEEE